MSYLRVIERLENMLRMPQEAEAGQVQILFKAGVHLLAGNWGGCLMDTSKAIQIAVAKADLLLCTWGVPVALCIVAVLAICWVIWYDDERKVR